MFTRRTAWVQQPNELAEKLLKIAEQKLPFFDLTLSNPTQAGFHYPEADILEALRKPQNLLYEPQPLGLLEAREAVCAYYAARGVVVRPEQILLTSGTSEAYTFLLRLLLEQGDVLAYPAPSYPLLDFLVDLADVTAIPYYLQPQMRWRATWPQKVSKVLVLFNPNNPTGNFLGDHELTELSGSLSAQETALICDEVFLDYAFPENEARSLLSHPISQNRLSFVLSGISKVLGLPQMKLSWIVVSGPESLAREAMARLEVIADTYLSVNVSVQRALPDWFAACTAIPQQIRNRTRENLAVLRHSIEEIELLRVLPVQGGWYALLELPADKTDKTWATLLLDEVGVFIHPGYFYHFQQTNIGVVSLLTQPEVFRQGIGKLIRYLRTGGD